MFRDHCLERRWEIVITTPNYLCNRHGPSKYLATLGRQGINKRSRQQYEAQEPSTGFEWNLKHQFDWIIVDEAHLLKNAGTKINRTVC
jgi:hypothetical protein